MMAVNFGLEQQKNLTPMQNELANDEEPQNIITNNTRQ